MHSERRAAHGSRRSCSRRSSTSSATARRSSRPWRRRIDLRSGRRRDARGGGRAAPRGRTGRSSGLGERDFGPICGITRLADGYLAAVDRRFESGLAVGVNAPSLFDNLSRNRLEPPRRCVGSWKRSTLHATRTLLPRDAVSSGGHWSSRIPSISMSDWIVVGRDRARRRTARRGSGLPLPSIVSLRLDP